MLGSLGLAALLAVGQETSENTDTAGTTYPKRQPCKSAETGR